jgi:hypothetical protein
LLLGIVQTLKKVSPLKDSEIKIKPLLVKDLDFRDLTMIDDVDPTQIVDAIPPHAQAVCGSGGPPPPPPPMPSFGGPPPTPERPSPTSILTSESASIKLTKLHWKEAYTMTKTKDDSIWNDIVKTDVDKEKLSHLFKLKQSEFKTKVSRMVLFFVLFE